MTDHPSTLLDLAFGQHIPLAFEGILTGFEFQLDGRPGDGHGVPEIINQVAFVAPRNLLNLIAMDDDRRWISTALMSVLQLDPATPHQGRLVRIDGGLQ